MDKRKLLTGWLSQMHSADYASRDTKDLSDYGS
jgi:hypothetical protein